MILRSVSTVAAVASLMLVAACNNPPAETTPAEPAAPTAPAAPADPNALTSAGLGPLRIGMTRAEVEAAWGATANPNAVGGADPEACDEFRPSRAPEGTLVMIEQGRLTRISLIRDSSVRTDRGFGLGQQAAVVKAAYGAEARVSPHKYQDAPAEYITVWSSGAGPEEYVQNPEARGLVYEIGGDGTVTAIRAGGPSIQYVEGCS